MIADRKAKLPASESNNSVSNGSMKRYLIQQFHFDSRAMSLDASHISPNWEPDVLKLHIENCRKGGIELTFEYGLHNFQRKIDDFIAFGRIPFSIVASHNAIFTEIQTAFVAGAYYPALVSACTLAERILNELIYGLKDDFVHHELYRTINKKEWLQNWDTAVQVLIAWGIIRDTLRQSFADLHELRSFAVHFRNYEDALRRDKALQAIRSILKIVTEIFGIDGGRYWMLRGVEGAIFIAAEYERDPFVRTYLIPAANLVGPYYSMEFSAGRFVLIDYPDYPEADITDDEFAKLHRERTPTQLARHSDKNGDAVS